MSGLPSTLLVQLEDATGAFTHDITSRVSLKDGWTVRRGRNDEDDAVEVGQLQIRLDNNDGRFTRGSPAYDGIDADKRIRITESFGSVVSARHTGYVQAWPTVWDAPMATVAISRLVSSDGQSRLNRRPLRSLVELELMADGPSALYRLSEPAGSTSAGDTSGNGRPPLTISSYYTDGTNALPTFGAAGPASWDSGVTAVKANSGRNLGGPVVVTAGESGFTAKIAASISNTTDLVGFLMLLSNDESGAGSLTVALVVRAVGSEVNYYLLDRTGGSAITSGPLPRDTAWHDYAVTVNGATYSLYRDATLIATGDAVAPVPAGTDVSVRAIGSGSIFTYADFATYPATLSPTRLAAQSAAILNGFAGQSTDQRLNHLADYAHIPPAARDFEGGVVDMVPAAATTGSSTWSAMSDVNAAEGGVLFFAGDGRLTFHNRHHRVRSATRPPKLTLLAEHLDHDALEFEGGKDYLFNVVTGNRDGGAEQRIENTASIARYDEYPDARGTLLLSDDMQVVDLLQWRASRYGTLRDRLSTVQLDLLTLADAHPDLVAAALQLELGDRVTISGWPSQSPVPVADLIVEGLVEEQQLSPSSSKWTLTLNTAPADLFRAWILGDPTYGRLGSTTVLHY